MVQHMAGMAGDLVLVVKQGSIQIGDDNVKHTLLAWLDNLCAV
jgi:hypothetical protein